MFVSGLVLVKFILSMIGFVRISFFEQYCIKSEAWDVIRSPFQANRINDTSMKIINFKKF
jgi:hypothetical protein